MKKIALLFLIFILNISSASGITLKIATATPEGTQWMNDMRASAKEIYDKTQGRVNIKYYGGGIKGSDSKVLSQIRIKQLQGGAFTPTSLAAQYPNLNIYGMPLVFNSEQEATYVRSKMDLILQKGLEDSGFVNFGFATSGFANIMSSEPVKTLEDLKGKRVWVPEGDIMSYKSMEALSLNPVTLPITDVLTGLQTGLIDIVTIPTIVGLVLQWHTKVKYITPVPLIYTFGYMAIDKKVFDKIDIKDQVIIREVMNRTYDKFDELNLIDNENAYAALIRSGIQEIRFDEIELNKVRELLLKSNLKLGSAGGFSLELYKEMLSHIAEFRDNKIINSE
ncbi:MAG: C4-dicarboxylate ABC transporter [Gammaproteobacteria bacterium]|nr:C4-dicarboxylate ABC transporter [Gammaproteobacteria bacterium]|tara:strand:- start:965 stop:1972 length:1008 start_codon:yes stop_codon:yes gene_type:complete